MIENTPQQINIKEIFESKNKPLAKLLPGFILRYLKKVIHQDDLNQFLRKHADKYGITFIKAALEDFKISLDVKGKENIPNTGRNIFVSNHPLGGFDGLILLYVLSEFYGQHQRFLVNDILMNIKNLKELFVPINKHGKQAVDAVQELNDIFSGDMQVLTFPAGLVSRRINGTIVDLEWKKTFINRAIKHQRDIVPVYFSGRNSDFFYNLSNFRKRVGIKANIEMLYLVDELYKHTNTTVTLSFGEKIPYTTFDKSKNHRDWAFWVKQQVYKINNQQVEI